MSIFVQDCPCGKNVMWDKRNEKDIGINKKRCISYGYVCIFYFDRADRNSVIYVRFSENYGISSLHPLFEP